MNCTQCGEDISEDMHGNLYHTYRLHDSHTPEVDV
jgi:hypothetical protein